MRSPGGTRRHFWYASLAVATTFATVAASDSGAVAMTEPVAGLWMGAASDTPARSQWPPT